MKKLMALVLAVLVWPAACGLDRAGLVQGTSSPGIDGGAKHDSGQAAQGAIDSRAAKDSIVAPIDVLASGGLGSALGTSAGGAPGARPSGGASGAVTASGGSTTPGVPSSGGLPAAGGAPAIGGGSGGAPSAGGAIATGGIAAVAGAVSSGGSIPTAGTVAAGGTTTTGGITTTGGTTVVSSGGAGPDASVPPDAPGTPDVPVSTPDAAPAMTLVWSDEFDGESGSRADTTKWTYVAWPAGQMNNEKQQYTNRTTNAFLDGSGNLVIRALRPESNQYTSARLDTKGKFSLRTGRVEVRAKLPGGVGSAPGIALLATSGTWPNSGELALMEQGGQDKSWFYSTAYAGGASGDTGHVRYDFANATTATTEFHVYSLDWYADGLVFAVDGNNITSTSYDSTSPFASIAESVVLYVAVGGDLGGAVDSKGFPMDMVIDYVRVYAF